MDRWRPGRKHLRRCILYDSLAPVRCAWQLHWEDCQHRIFVQLSNKHENAHGSHFFNCFQ